MHTLLATGRAARLTTLGLGLALLGLLLPIATHRADGARPDAAVHAQEGARTWSRTAVRVPGFDAGALLDPRGVDGAPDGRFYVADRGHDRVVVIDSAGRIVDTFGTRGDGPRELASPSDVAVDSARDRLYVADYANKRVSVRQLDGNPVAQWSSGAPDFALVPVAVAVAPGSGDVYVLSKIPWGRVERFAADGTWLGGWGDIGAGPGQFSGPLDVAVHPDGRVLVADTNNSRVQVFGPDGSHQADLDGLTAVHAVAVDPASGDIYALHSEPGVFSFADRVTVMAADGQVRHVVESSQLGAPFVPGIGLAVSAGRMAVTTSFGGQGGRHGLRQYPTGTPSPTLAASTLANPLDHAGFFRPEAIDVGPDGRLFVTEGLLRVTKRYGPDGAFQTRLDEAMGDELTVGPDGALYLADTGAYGGRVVLRRLLPDGTLDWEKPCDCLNGMGLAAAADAVHATAAISQSVVTFDLDRFQLDPVASRSTDDPPYAWPLDLARGPSGRLYAAGGQSGQLHVLEPSGGTVLAAWPLPGGGAERVSVAPDGTVFVLLLDGTLAALGPDGALEARWSPEPAPGQTAVFPEDIAAGPEARLYVLDETSHAVFVYDASAAPAETPVPTPTAAPPCTVTGDKTAAPEVVQLGDPVTVQLTLDISCRAGQEPQADILLVIDRSSSMSGLKLDDARAAATGFVDRVDLSRHRIGLVGFSDIVTLEQPLTADGAAVKAAIGRLQAARSTDIAGAIDRSLAHLAAAGRSDALPVVLLLTDGKPTRPGQPFVDAVRQGARAGARGALVYTIGLGADVKDALLVAVAGAAARYFEAPSADQLDPIYQLLSETVGDVAATDVRVVDDLSADVSYVEGSASGDVAVSGRQLTWTLGTLPSTGAQLRYEVRPDRLGRVPTNAQAVAFYTADGREWQFTYPVPEVEVVDRPTPTPTASATTTATPRPTPTATPTRRPGQPSVAYLPLVMRGACRPAERRLGADIVMVIDTSSSMQGAKLDAAVAAGKRFVDELDPRRDRVGLVTFDFEARLWSGITADLTLVKERLDALGARRGTRIDLGLAEARQQLRFWARDGSQRVIVLLSDGRPQGGSEAATEAQATLAKVEGATLFAVGLGDADGALLGRMATSRSHYFFAPGPAELGAIYARIAAELPCR